MNERRRYKRLPLELHLKINEMFKQDHIVIKNTDVKITVFDISKNGIGFVSREIMPVGYYFSGMIRLGEKDFFRVVIQIVRVSNGERDDLRVYGAIFVGLAPFLADKVDAYEKGLVNGHKEKEG